MRRLTTVVLALVVSLALMGVGYALWSETINISGRVNTGELDWQFRYASVDDRYAPPPMSGPGTISDLTCDPGFGNIRETGKNVAWGSTQISGDGHTLDFQLNNVYPCYFNKLEVYPVNTGTIPLHIERVIFKDNNGNVIRTFEQRGGAYPIVELDLSGDGNADIELLWGNHIGTQLHPGDNPVEISMWVHVLQACPESAQLSFSVEIEAVQYNESIHPIN